MEQTIKAKTSAVATAGGNMTEDATELMQRLTVFGSKALQAMSGEEVVYGMMGAAINLALSQMHHAELCDWMRRLADGIDAECGAQKPS